MRPRAIYGRCATILCVAMLAVAGAAADDSAAVGEWPRWRGPNSSGASIGGPTLAAKWPAEGPPKQWETFLAGATGDCYGSPAAADGKVFMSLMAWQFLPTKESLATLPDLGVPPAAVEEITTKGLYAGSEEQWLRQYKIPLDKKAAILAALGKTRSIDRVAGLDAITGKVLWKMDYLLDAPGRARGTASTPCFWKGRVYGSQTKRAVYCIDATTGNEVWINKDCGGGFSSVVVEDGVVVATGSGVLTAMDAQTGKQLWTGGDVATDYSPAIWHHDGKTYVISSRGNGPQFLRCNEITSGKPLWTCPAIAHTAAIEGDYMAALDYNAKSAVPNRWMHGCLAIYRLSSNKPEKVGEVDLADAASCPIICHGYVYYTACGRAVCVEAKTGTVKWNEPIECGGTGVGIRGRLWSSPLIADGKLFAVLDWAKNGGPDGGGTEPIGLFDANPEKFAALGVFNARLLGCTSPAVAGTKLFVHTTTGIACFDLAPDAKTVDPAK